MARFFEFVMNHWVLCGAFVFLLMMLVGGEVRQRLHGIKKLSVQELVTMMNGQNPVLIDVRAEKDFEAGHISGAVSLPFQRVGKEIAGVLAKHKDKPIILIDSLGHQAVAAGAMLSKQGFKPLYTLAGGQAAWEGQHMPLDKKG